MYLFIIFQQDEESAGKSFLPIPTSSHLKGLEVHSQDIR